MFHENLLKELNSQLKQNSLPGGTTTPSSLQFSDVPEVPEAQDQIIPFENSAFYLVKSLWNELGPTNLRRKRIPWHGKPIDFSIPYVTRTKAVDIQPEVVGKLRKACNEHATSITGLCHALALASFAARLPASEASFFVASTPISLRPFLGLNADNKSRNLFRVLVTSVEHEFQPILVSQFRDSAKNAALDDAIWNIAQMVKTELNKRVASIPKDDISGLMKYNSDWFGYFQNKDGKSRTRSWEVSNIGVFKDGPDMPGFTVSRVYFTNGAMVAGSPVALGVASVPEGTLTVALSWQETVVTDELVDKLACDLATFVDRFW